MTLVFLNGGDLFGRSGIRSAGGVFLFLTERLDTSSHTRGAPSIDAAKVLLEGGTCSRRRRLKSFQISL